MNITHFFEIIGLVFMSLIMCIMLTGGFVLFITDEVIRRLSDLYGKIKHQHKATMVARQEKITTIYFYIGFSSMAILLITCMVLNPAHDMI